MSTFLLGPYPQSRSMCQEVLNRTLTLLNRRRIVLNTLNSQGDLYPFSVPLRQQFSKSTGAVAIQGRDQIIQQSRHMAIIIIIHTIMNLLGVKTLMPSTQSMGISDLIQVVDEDPMQLLGPSIPQPRILNTQLMSSTIMAGRTLSMPPMTT